MDILVIYICKIDLKRQKEHSSLEYSDKKSVILTLATFQQYLGLLLFFRFQANLQ